jgi:hypothetical protein
MTYAREGIDELRRRTTMEVLEDHLLQVDEGTIDEDLERNYTVDVVVISRHGVLRGHDALRDLARLLQEELPDATFEYVTLLAEGEVAFLEWRAESEKTYVEDGADSFVVRDGRIVAQTIHYAVRERPYGSPQ